MKLKELNKLIDEFRSKGKKPIKLIIGYKDYAVLMENEKFQDRLTRDINDPMIRYYKGIKIKMVTEKHYLEIV
ncbi:hypothetical protein ACOUV0_15930 [Acinetobacter baumannii]|uniref:hypothetical protein n=1 Tax=Acinetobacter calcoaceticus/baumannii complex TaxID=909768 RepID=UPI000BBCA735|nr:MULTISPECIES: hypothetical protein [Acinetobacter calcoaceticus/baumannii complex]AXX52276.1 hypothetical protein Aba9102_07700 [Acinetobacter baumannii]EKW4080116.1 hypothetical protein [Acinetobacter baumannii]MCY3199485.1 hypothetical protein [Acinetobacter baumannii]MDE4038328.1 hypothetical protein [Acinetobacter pittii]MDV7377636.1 hypothetical protein [Acinetobacter baumannii]